MSTDYFITDRAKPTLKSLTDAGVKVEEHKGFDTNGLGEVVLTDGTNYVHSLVRKRGNGPERVLHFTRFGGNDPYFMIAALEELGYDVVSEYD